MRDMSCRGTARWWPIHELWLCRRQVIFLLEHVEDMDDGKYPDNPYESGYTEAAHTFTRIGNRAPFESVIQLRAELLKRLDKTGVAGKWLLREVQAGVPLEQLDYEPRLALHFISGWWERKCSFKRWVWDQEHRRKPHWIIV